jgi:hypothetical protein
MTAPRKDPVLLDSELIDKALRSNTSYRTWPIPVRLHYVLRRTSRDARIRDPEPAKDSELKSRNPSQLLSSGSVNNPRP